MKYIEHDNNIANIAQYLTVWSQDVIKLRKKTFMKCQ